MPHPSNFRPRYGLEAGQELQPRDRSRRSLLAPQATQMESLRLQIVADAEQAAKAGHEGAAAVFYHVLQYFGMKRPDGILVYSPEAAGAVANNLANTLPTVQALGTTAPNCPCCHSNARVIVSPPESAARGKWFCPCNEPGGTSGHFDDTPPPPPAPVKTEVAPDGILAKQIAAATTVKLRTALLKLQAEDKPDAVKLAEAAALLAKK